MIATMNINYVPVVEYSSSRGHMSDFRCSGGRSLLDDTILYQTLIQRFKGLHYALDVEISLKYGAR